MEHSFNAPAGPEHAATATTTAQKTTQILALGLDENQRCEGQAQNDLDNAQIWCPRL